MNNLIKINLLPYREEMNKRKQQQFKTLMYGVVLTGVAAVAATYLFIDNMINKQSEKTRCWKSPSHTWIPSCRKYKSSNRKKMPS